MQLKKIELTQTQIIIISSLFFTLFYNYTFFKKSFEAFGNIGFIIALGALLYIVISTLLAIISNRFTIKPVLIILFLTSSVASYYMNLYSTIIDDKMIQNIFETDKREVYDLLNVKLFINFFF